MTAPPSPDRDRRVSPLDLLGGGPICAGERKVWRPKQQRLGVECAWRQSRSGLQTTTSRRCCQRLQGSVRVACHLTRVLGMAGGLAGSWAPPCPNQIRPDAGLGETLARGGDGEALGPISGAWDASASPSGELPAACSLGCTWPSGCACTGRPRNVMEAGRAGPGLGCVNQVPAGGHCVCAAGVPRTARTEGRHILAGRSADLDCSGTGSAM